jgi:hypothetical protein
MPTGKKKNPDEDFYFIDTNGDPIDQIHVHGPGGVKTLEAKDGYYKAVLRESNLTEGEVEVLALVRKHKGEGMAKKIADELGKERSWISYVLNRLVELGHLTKVKRGLYHDL